MSTLSKGGFDEFFYFYASFARERKGGEI